MFCDLNEKLVKVKEKVLLYEKYNSDIKRIEELYNQRQRDCKELEETMNKEKRDVEKLEGLSLTGLFHTILGDKETKLDKEKQEFLKAKLLHEECKNQLSYISGELQVVKNKIRELGNPAMEYESIIKEKEKILESIKDMDLDKFHGFVSTESKLKVEDKEIHEALTTGKRAVSAIEDVISSLKGAENWGTWDMFGGGMIATSIKHSRIDDARRMASIAQRCLTMFNSELRDIENISNVNFDINIGSFNKFADYFFDNLISDWVVQSRIKDSLDNMIRTRERINLILRNLEGRKNRVIMELQKISQDKVKFIEEFQ